MKLLFLVSSLPLTKIGGTEIITLKICERLFRHSGHEIFLYTIPQKEEEKSEECLFKLAEKYDLHTFPLKNIIFSEKVNSDSPFSYTLSNLSFALNLKKVVRNLKPNVVISMKVQPPDVFCGFLTSLSKKEKLPYLFMVRGFTDLLNAPFLESYAKSLPISERIKNRIFYSYLLPKYINGAAEVIVQTRSQKEYVLKRYKRVAHLLFNPVDVETIQRTVKKEEKGENEFRLVYVGSMIPRKNLETLLKGVHLLVREKKLKKLVLFLVGGGRGEEKVKNQVEKLDLKNWVVFKGPLPPAHLWSFLARCDVFVFPSLSEGFPNVLLEAMAVGLPVVSSDFAGVEDVIRSQKNGLIFPKNDHRALTEKIMFLYENEKYRKEIGRYNREFVKEFSWEKFIQSFEKILSGIK